MKASQWSGRGGDTITSVGASAETTPTSRANGSDEPTSAADSVAGVMSALGEAAVEYVVCVRLHQHWSDDVHVWSGWS